jgi:hypothetical protein
MSDTAAPSAETPAAAAAPAAAPAPVLETPQAQDLPEDGSARLAAIMARAEAGLPLDPDAPATAPAAKTEGETPKTEGDPAATEEAKKDETPDVRQARKILAAAQKREDRAVAKMTEAKAAISAAKKYADLQTTAKTDPLTAALKVTGHKTLKEFLAAISGSEPAAPTVEDKLSAVEKKLADKERAETEAVSIKRFEAMQANVFKVVDEAPASDRVTSPMGHKLLWQEIEAYGEKYGPKSVTNKVLWRLVEGVEKYLKDEGMVSRKKSSAKPAATNAPAPPAPSKTLTSDMTRAAPPVSSSEDDLPMDPKARLNAVLARYATA